MRSFAWSNITCETGDWHHDKHIYELWSLGLLNRQLVGCVTDKLCALSAGGRGVEGVWGKGGGLQWTQTAGSADKVKLNIRGDSVTFIQLAENSRHYPNDMLNICTSGTFFCWLGDCDSDEKEEEEYEEEVGEDGEIILVSGDKMSGPWNKSGAPPPAAASVGGYTSLRAVY